jgi:hypothetical protein
MFLNYFENLENRFFQWSDLGSDPDLAPFKEERICEHFFQLHTRILVYGKCLCTIVGILLDCSFNKRGNQLSVGCRADRTRAQQLSHVRLTSPVTLVG